MGSSQRKEHDSVGCCDDDCYQSRQEQKVIDLKPTINLVRYR